MPIETQEFMTEQHLGVIREKARSIRRQYLKYKDAEVVYSLTHRKLLHTCKIKWKNADINI